MFAFLLHKNRDFVLKFVIWKASSSCSWSQTTFYGSANDWPELQIRGVGVLKIIQRLVFLFLNENICCDP